MDVHRGTDRPLTGDLALELRDVHVRFGDVRALDGATLRTRAGTVHGLLGENGAGKTTLMRVAYGMLRPEAGTIEIDGLPTRLHSPADAIRAGVAMVHQHFTLVPAMTVAENVALGGGIGIRAREQSAPATRSTLRTALDEWRFDARGTTALIRAIGESTGLRLDPDARVESLGVGARQRLEIVKALARNARVLILDEPTAVLPPSEAAELMRRLRQLADEGRTVVLITHKLREALAIADEVTVLRHGRTVLHAAARELSPIRLAAAMLGTTPGDPSGPVLTTVLQTEGEPLAGGRRGSDEVAAAALRPPVVTARDLHVRDERGVLRIRAATFDIHAGQIVGLAAVEGSGHRELLRALAGRITTPTSGTLALPRAIGFIPEDRHHEALALDLTLTENIALRGAGARRNLVQWRAMARRTRDLMRAFDVRAPSERVAARALSGGNQQKLVLAREMDEGPALLVAENPTRGLDVRAAATIHRRLREARDSGTAIVLFSGDLDEMLALADRVLVVYEGTVREVAHDRSAIGAAMVGLT